MSKLSDRQYSTQPIDDDLDDPTGNRKRQKKKHLDQKQQELKSQLEQSKEHEIALKKHSNTLSTLDFFSKGKAKNA